MLKTIKSATQKEYQARIIKVLQYINDNIEGDLSLKTLSDVSCFSQYHFHRIFSAYLRESPADYINRIRIEKAAVLLIYQPQMTVTEIALKCGFSSSSTFARAFKQFYGCSSSEWRKDGFRKHLNSKNRKADSKNWKESEPSDGYFSDVIYTSYNFEGLNMNYEIKTLPQTRIAYLVNFNGYEETSIGITYEKLCRWAGSRGLMNAETKIIGVSFDDPDITPVEKCRYYAGLTVPESIQPEGEILLMDLPGGKYLVARYEGPGSGIAAAYKNVYQELLPENGFLPGESVCYEIYYNDPLPEKKFVMDICVPVKPM
jgi:AraC family transcriptional regulator